MDHHDFDRAYWQQHWRAGRIGRTAPANPYLAEELAGLVPGTALDAGCGAGAEAIWLAGHGWEVTAADISAEALARAAERAQAAEVAVRWVEADLSTWEPTTRFDLVTTHYAHPAIPQLEFYDRLARWVRPGGALLIVGHLHTHGHTHGHGHDDEPPAEASVTAAAVTARLDGTAWRVETAVERQRAVPGRERPLHDVVVRATRLA
jgi:SAM-dependent methyltransferase